MQIIQISRKDVGWNTGFREARGSPFNPPDKWEVEGEYECDDVYRVGFMSKPGMHVYPQRVTVFRDCLDTCDGLIRFEDV